MTNKLNFNHLKSYKNLSKRLFTSKVFLRSTAISTMFVVLASSVFTVSALNKDFEIIDGEQVSTVKVINTNTDKILKRANVSLGPDDKVLRDDQEDKLTVKRAFNVSIKADGETKVMTFNDGTVAYALHEAGIQLESNDKVNYELLNALVPDMEIEVTRFYNISLSVNGNNCMIYVPKGTVGETLDYLGIELGKEDKVNLDLSTQIEKEMHLEVTRIGYNEKTETKSIPYATVTIKTDKLLRGEQEVETEGANGERTILIREKLVNGEVVETTEVKELSRIEPVDRVILEGTATATQKSSSNSVAKNSDSNSSSNSNSKSNSNSVVNVSGKPISYKSVLKGSCTAYTSSPGALTSTGKIAQVGYVAVNPNIIPYGTELYICSEDGSFVYGYAIAADTGGALMNGSALVDLYYNSESECINFGRRTLNVYILN